MKTTLKILCLLGALLVVAVAVIFVLLGGPQSFSFRRQFDMLVKTNDHKAVAWAAIAVIRATTNDTIFRGDRLTNLPPLITRMKPEYVSVSPEGMTIEFHGGFDHFGFEIRDAEDVWEMTQYTEQERRSILKIGKADGTGQQVDGAKGNHLIGSETNGKSPAAGSVQPH